MLLKLDQEKEIRYEYDSFEYPLDWLEIYNADEHYVMSMWDK